MVERDKLLATILAATMSGHYHQWREEKTRKNYFTGFIHDEIVVGVPVITQVGCYYLHKGRGHPVKVISGRNQVWTDGDPAWLYQVEDVVTGQEFNVQRRELGEELNEMEVIAWAVSK